MLSDKSKNETKPKQQQKQNNTGQIEKKKVPRANETRVKCKPQFLVLETSVNIHIWKIFQ